MIKIANDSQITTLALRQEVLAVVKEALTVLDEEYGENRNVDCDLGGYVLVVESEKELAQLKDIHIDLEQDLPEYVETIHCSEGEDFASCLLLLGSDFSVLLILPMASVPEHWKQYIIS